jgi:hypothetical protein
MEMAAEVVVSGVIGMIFVEKPAPFLPPEEEWP